MIHNPDLWLSPAGCVLTGRLRGSYQRPVSGLRRHTSAAVGAARGQDGQVRQVQGRLQEEHGRIWNLTVSPVQRHHLSKTSSWNCNFSRSKSQALVSTTKQCGVFSFCLLIVLLLDKSDPEKTWQTNGAVSFQKTRVYLFCVTSTWSMFKSE